MSSPIKNIIKHSSVYSFSNILSKSIGFLLIPVYTRYLTPSDYGTLEILSITSQVLIIICTLGIGNGLLRVYLYDCKNQDEQKQATTAAYLFITFMSLLIFGLAIILASNISELAFDSSKLSFWFIIVFISGLLSVNNVIPMRVYRAERQSVKFTFVNLSKFILVLLSNIYFVVYLRLGVVGVLYGSLIGAAFAFGLNFVFVRNYFTRKFSFVQIKKMFRFGFPLLPAMLALWIITSTDKYLLAQYSSLHDLGLYSMGLRFAVIFEIVFRMPFDTNWPSICFPLAKQENAKQEFSKIFTYYLLAGSFLALTLALLAKPAIHIMTTHDYYESYQVVPILVAAFMFRGISSNIGIGIWLSGKTEYQALIMIGASVMNILLNFILIPIWGTMGAATATIISFMVMAFAHYTISQKLFPVKYEALRIIKLGVAFSLPLILYYLYSPESTMIQVMLAFLLCLSFILLLIILNFFTDEEINWLKRTMQKRKLAFAVVTSVRNRF
ncbi:MAG: lipopolysaccharide biosynthesis protein [bacterium]